MVVRRTHLRVVVCAIDGCDTQFKQTQWNQKYCKEHGWQEAQRLKYWVNVEKQNSEKEDRECVRDGCTIRFKPKSGRHIFCSLECYKKAKHPKHNRKKICEVCNKTYFSMAHNKKWCSPECAILGQDRIRAERVEQAREARSEIKACPNCKKEFKTANRRKIYCSRTCVVRAYNRKAKFNNKQRKKGIPHSYIITEVGLEEYIKIGKTDNGVDNRIRDLQIGNPRELSIVYVFDAIKDGLGELELQDKFKPLRVRGEWYQFTKEMREFFERQENLLNNL